MLVVVLSDTAGLPLQTLAEAKEKRGNGLARALGCVRSTPALSIACLRSKSWMEVVNAQHITLGEQPARDGQLSMMEYGGPVMDGINFEDTSLLASIRAGRFHRVPLLTGTSRDEAGMYIMQTFPIMVCVRSIDPIDPIQPIQPIQPIHNRFDRSIDPRATDHLTECVVVCCFVFS